MRHDHRTDRDTTVRHGRTDSLRTTSRGDLAHLGALDDFEIADGEPDIRGWDVKGPDGRRLGEVSDLLVDTAAMKVRYLEVKLDGDVADAAARAAGTADPRTEATRYRLVPIGVAQLDDREDDVLLGDAAARFVGMPAYGRDGVTREYESRLLEGYGREERAARGTNDFYAGREFDDRALRGARGGAPARGHDDATYLTRSEERLAVGTRRVDAGTVDVRKRVETERVREAVPVTHEEVTVERRPVSADAARGADARIGDGEIRVPVMAEEVVTEKRVVPQEEIVIRKHAVTEQRTVEADLRRERIDVDDAVDDARRARAGRPADGDRRAR